MAAKDKSGAAPVVLIHGEDEYSVKGRARGIWQDWQAAAGSEDCEILDGAAANSGEALQVLARLREALQTLPFFGGTKLIWLRDVSFLGDDRTANAAAVNETVGEVARELKDFDWSGVQLLVSAGKVDRRKIFYKSLKQIGQVEAFASWANERDWAERAEDWARERLRDQGKTMHPEALAALVAAVGPQPRQLESELEKLALYAGDRNALEAADVEAVAVRNKQAQAFAVGDALGDRDLPKLLKVLDEALWEVRLDTTKSEIGLLYGLISKVRSLLLAKALVERGHLRAGLTYPQLQGALKRLPEEGLPEDDRMNPRKIHPFVLFNALRQARNFRVEELIRAMALLLECNRLLVSSSLDTVLVLQQTLVTIVEREKAG